MSIRVWRVVSFGCFLTSVRGFVRAQYMETGTACQRRAVVAGMEHIRRDEDGDAVQVRAALSGTGMAPVAREGAHPGLMYVAETGAVAAATLIIGNFGAVTVAGNQVAMSVVA
jgi:hypothetical protein